MEPELKKMVMDDLDRFVRRKELYKKVGKAWKRGYLICGPPGAGKSSLIAAMANYLKFNIYDLNISSRLSDLQLRKFLLSTSNRSILVIEFEDIDRAAELNDRERRDELVSIFYSHKNWFTITPIYLLAPYISQQYTLIQLNSCKNHIV